MKSLLILAAIVFATATALGQQQSSVNPLNDLGIAFGASVTDVIDACERAGLTIVRIDTGSRCPEGSFLIRASGARYLGEPATLWLGGGASWSTDATVSGLRSVSALLESDTPASLRSAMSRCLDTLVWTYGPSKYFRARPAVIERSGFAEEHLWRKSTRAQGDSLQVRVEACLDAPVAGRYVVKVQFAQVDR